MNLSELKSDARFITNTNETSYPDTDLERNLNQWYKTAVVWIWKASGLWEYDDSNKSTLPEATTDLVDGQQDYPIPSDALRIHDVEVKNNSGDWHELPQIDKSEIPGGVSEYFDEDGFPKYYDLLGDSIELYPAPDASEVTTASGLRLHVSRSVDALSVSGDTPGFDSSFHKILSRGAAVDYTLKSRDRTKQSDLRNELSGLREDLLSEYSRRNKDRKTRINRNIENYS